MVFALASRDGAIVMGNNSHWKDFVTLRLLQESKHMATIKLYACLAFGAE